MEELLAHPHRKKLIVFLACRLIWKRSADEAEDCRTAIAEYWRAPAARRDLVVIFTHIAFARKGARVMNDVMLRRKEHDVVSCFPAMLRDMRDGLHALPSHENKKVSDRARLFTGIAFVRKVLKKPALMQKLQEGVRGLQALHLFAPRPLHFRTVYDAALKMPFYGKARSANFTRLVDVVRRAASISSLEITGQPRPTRGHGWS